MGDEEKQTGRGKVPYEPPRLLTIDLAAEEVLVGACKLASGTGPGNPPSDPCNAIVCYDMGS